MDVTKAPSEKREKEKGFSKLWKRLKAALNDKKTTSQSQTPIASQQSRNRNTDTTEQATQPALLPDVPAVPQIQELTPADSGSSTIHPPPPTAQPVVPQMASAPAEAARPRATLNAPVDAESWNNEKTRRMKATLEKWSHVLTEAGEVPIEYIEIRPRNPQERVHKPVRMRIKYTCHNCRTVFGHDRICLGCQHRRCIECVRYPPKRRSNKSKEPADRAVIEVNEQSESPPQCTCHECQTTFTLGTVECPNCHHTVCDECRKNTDAALIIETQPLSPDTRMTLATERTTTRQSDIAAVVAEVAS